MTSRQFVLKMAKGYQGRSKNCFSIAKQKVERAMLNAYKSRRLKKRDMRSLWIQQLNAAARVHNTTYSRFQRGLIVESIIIDRKVLATLATYEPLSFSALATVANTAWLRECGSHHGQALAKAISNAELQSSQASSSSSRVQMEDN